MNLRYDPAIKRLFDIVLSLGGLALLGLPMLLVAMAIRLGSPGPALFRQTRVGKAGRLFTIHKFRTMSVQPEAEAGFQPGDVSRVTPLGRMLRKAKLDELPQLLDVLTGSMSLVGPRPETPDWLARYRPDDRRRLLAVRPGLVDFASLRFLDEERQLAEAADPIGHYRDVIVPLKARLAAHYARRITLTTDARIVIATILALAGIRKPRQPIAPAARGGGPSHRRA